MKYKDWETRFREYTGRGIDLIEAWHRANRDFGIGKKELAEWEEKYGPLKELEDEVGTSS
jgi:hypothetical protein